MSLVWGLSLTWGLEAAVSAPLAMMIYVVATALIWLPPKYANARLDSALHKYPGHSCAPTIVHLGYFWEVLEWPLADMITAANMVNGGQLMPPANRTPNHPFHHNPNVDKYFAKEVRAPFHHRLLQKLRFSIEPALLSPCISVLSQAGNELETRTRTRKQILAYLFFTKANVLNFLSAVLRLASGDFNTWGCVAMLHIISQTSNEQRGEVAPPLEECS